MSNKEQEYYTKTQLIKERNWTNKAISLFLGECDLLKTNPRYKKAQPMQLFKIDRVHEVEQSPEFIVFIKKKEVSRAKQSESMSKRMDEKRKEMYQWIDNLEIVVPKLSYPQLIRQACEHYNNLQLERKNYDPLYIAGPSSDINFLFRITNNYLRHCMTDYEYLLNQTFGKVGKDSAYEKIKCKVMSELKKTYPDLMNFLSRSVNRDTAEQPLTKGNGCDI